MEIEAQPRSARPFFDETLDGGLEADIVEGDRAQFPREAAISDPTVVVRLFSSATPDFSGEASGALWPKASSFMVIAARY